MESFAAQSAPRDALEAVLAIEGSVNWDDVTHRIGSYRVVILFPTVVIKLPRTTKGTEGIWCNMRELEIFKAAPHPFLCPILSWCPEGKWLVMRRATPISFEERNQRSAELTRLSWQLNRLFAKMGNAIEVGDTTPANLGKVQSRLVLVDYAGVPPTLVAAE